MKCIAIFNLLLVTGGGGGHHGPPPIIHYVKGGAVGNNGLTWAAKWMDTSNGDQYWFNGGRYDFAVSDLA